MFANRRMRNASLDELPRLLDEYKGNLQAQLNYFTKQISDAGNILSDAVNKMGSPNPSDRVEAREEAKDTIVKLVNGYDDFPGLSELPETGDYAALYDKINEEYQSLAKTRQLPETYNQLNETYETFSTQLQKCESVLDGFINSLGAYGADYAQEWNPFKDEVLRIVQTYGNIILQLLETDDSQRGNYVNANYRSLNDLYTSLNYYVRQLSQTFKNGAPEQVQTPYEELLDLLKSMLDNMGEMYAEFLRKR